MRQVGPGRGYGLVAGRRILNGDLVTYFHGERVHEDDMEGREQGACSHSIHIQNTDYVIDGKDFIATVIQRGTVGENEGVAHLVNSAPHSREANTNLEWRSDKRVARSLRGMADAVGWLVATRDVEVGEEVTWCYDYRKWAAPNPSECEASPSTAMPTEAEEEAMVRSSTALDERRNNGSVITNTDGTEYCATLLSYYATVFSHYDTVFSYNTTVLSCYDTVLWYTARLFSYTATVFSCDATVLGL